VWDSFKRPGEKFYRVRDRVRGDKIICRCVEVYDAMAIAEAMNEHDARRENGRSGASTPIAEWHRPTD